MWSPKPNDPEHEKLIKQLETICKEKNIKVLPVPQYYGLEKNIQGDYKHLFSNEALLIRSTADLMIVGEVYTLLIDAKTTYRKETGNIAIELSSFYWALQHSRDGVEFYYCYLENNKIVMFSPRDNAPDAIIIQPLWRKHPHIEKLFNKYIDTIQYYFKNKFINIMRDVNTGGSQDPFILKSRQEIKQSSLIEYLELPRQKILHDFGPIRTPFMEDFS